MSAPDYVIITPVRNEGLYLQRTIDSVVSQTLKPRTWIIVNDGSTDGTAQLIDEAARQHPWIRAVHRADRGFRKQGAGVIEAFYDGYQLLEGQSWDFLVKLDGDLSFASDYFERCLARFAADERLGVGGGRICCCVNGATVDDSPMDPAFHVRGATKIYRQATWEAIGGLIRAPGWDALDEIKANMLGWKTCSFHDLDVLQLKPTGVADGTWSNWFKNGRANYIVGYHPLFMLLKCLKRLGTKPYGIGSLGLLAGFFTGYIRRVPQVDDPELVQYVRHQQIRRLLNQESLWAPKTV